MICVCCVYIHMIFFLARRISSHHQISHQSLWGDGWGGRGFGVDCRYHMRWLSALSLRNQGQGQLLRNHRTWFYFPAINLFDHAYRRAPDYFPGSAGFLRPVSRISRDLFFFFLLLIWKDCQISHKGNSYLWSIGMQKRKMHLLR